MLLKCIIFLFMVWNGKRKLLKKFLSSLRCYEAQYIMSIQKHLFGKVNKQENVCIVQI